MQSVCLWDHYSVPDSALGVKMLGEVTIAHQERCRSLSGYRQAGGPRREWLVSVAVALVNDSKHRTWVGRLSNSPVGLGHQALCVPFISVTSEIPQGLSAWNETEVPHVWLEVHFPINQDPRLREFFG